MWHFFNNVVCVSCFLPILTWKKSLCSYCCANEILVISENEYDMKKILTVSTAKLNAIFVSPLTYMALWIIFSFSFSFFEKFPSDFMFCNLIHIYKSCICSSSFLLFLILLFRIYGNMFHNISLLAAMVNVCLSICHLILCIDLLQNISLSECNSGRTQKLPFGVNTETELKHTTTTSGKTGTLVIWNIPH